MNMLEGSLDGGEDGLVCRIGAASLTLPAEMIQVRPALGKHAGRSVAVGIRPEALDEPGRVDADNEARLRGCVQAVEVLGPEQLAYVEIGARPVLVEEVLDGLVDQLEAEDRSELIADGVRAIVVARLDAAARFHAGDEIELAVDVRRLHFFDLESGRAIDV